jgi:hypothetical protein
MRRIAYMLMGLGILVAVAGLFVLTWRGNLHQPFSQNEGMATALFVGGAALSYLGMLVRRRETVTKEHDYHASSPR